MLFLILSENGARRHAGLVLALLLITAVIYLIYRFHRLALFLVLKKLMDATGNLGGVK